MCAATIVLYPEQYGGNWLYVQVRYYIPLMPYAGPRVPLLCSSLAYTALPLPLAMQADIVYGVGSWLYVLGE